MQHDDSKDIRRRPDGSIDTAHYMKIGRQMRAEQAYKMVNSAVPKRRSFTFWFGPFATVRP
jgi:hypothetical protein